MNIVVVGGGGFLGFAIVKMLVAQGYNVTVIGRSYYPHLERMKIPVLQVDICDYDYLLNQLQTLKEPIDGVIHVASKVGISMRYDDYFKVNVKGTKNIIRACYALKVQYLVYTSTPSVVFREGVEFMGEDERLPYGFSKMSPYAYTKALAEKMVLEENSKKLKTIAIRPHLIWGIGDPHLMQKIINKSLKRKLYQIGDGKNLVDITHVDNAAYAHCLALKALAAGECGGRAYFIGQERPINLWEFIHSLVSTLTLRPIKKTISFEKAYELGRKFECLYRFLPHSWEPPMTRFLAHQLSKSHYFSQSNAIAQLDYKPIVSIKKGTSDFITDFFRAQFF